LNNFTKQLHGSSHYQFYVAAYFYWSWF